MVMKTQRFITLNVVKDHRSNARYNNVIKCYSFPTRAIVETGRLNAATKRGRTAKRQAAILILSSLSPPRFLQPLAKAIYTFAHTTHIQQPTPHLRYKPTKGDTTFPPRSKPHSVQTGLFSPQDAIEKNIH